MEQSIGTPEPTFGEKSFTMVGRAMTFVMRTMIPRAWQAVVQMLADTLPDRILLKEAKDLRWSHPDRHNLLVADLRDQGFVDAGTYRAVPLCNNVHLLVNQAYDLRAIIYEHPSSGIVLDLITLYCDGTGMTFVNRSSPGYEQPPLHPNVYKGPVTAWELLDICLRERPDKPKFPVNRASARKLLELEYEFGAKRIRGETLNPVEIADAYSEIVDIYAQRRPRRLKKGKAASSQPAPVPEEAVPPDNPASVAPSAEEVPVAQIAIPFPRQDDGE